MKFWVTSERNSETPLRPFSTTPKTPKANYRKSTFKTYLPTLSKWSTNSKASKRSTCSGQEMLKSLTVPTSCSKDKDINTPQIGSNSTRSWSNGPTSDKFTTEKPHNSKAKWIDSKKKYSQIKNILIKKSMRFKGSGIEKSPVLAQTSNPKMLSICFKYSTQGLTTSNKTIRSAARPKIY